MCEVKELKKAERKINIVLKNGKIISSEWYEDNSEKLDDCINRTECEMEEYHKLLAERDIDETDIDRWYTIRQREKEGSNIYISDHAFKRMKERCGLNKKAAMRHLVKVVDKGQPLGDIKGYLAPWAKQKEDRQGEGEHCLLYGDYVYIFSYNTLVTVILKPQKGKVNYSVQ